MRDSPEKRAEREGTFPRDHVMRSGYVYLGQFIAHDLSRDLDTLPEANPNVERTLNYRTPRLDLEILYGFSRPAAAELYEPDGRLRLGVTEPAGNLVATAADLPRDGNGAARIIDPRNDDNLIVAQIHVLFGRFHNRVCELLADHPELSPPPIGAALPQQARRFVTWHYQWIVLHDFLPHVVQETTLRELHGNGFRLFSKKTNPSGRPFSLPVEFTLAAFRFGHAMVREDYFLNPTMRVVDASEIIRMTKRGGGIVRRLPASHVLSWPRFFGGSNSLVNRAEEINTFLSPALYELPWLPPARPGRMVPSLPEMTLRRGSRVRLPSGQEFARHFGYPVLPKDSIAANSNDDLFFRRTGLLERTPLWYYLLREAALEAIYEPEPGNRRTVQKLGTLGSRIVAETIWQVLLADKESILNAGKGWQPPPVLLEGLDEPRPLDSMAEIIRFACPELGEPQFTNICNFRERN